MQLLYSLQAIGIQLRKRRADETRADEEQQTQTALELSPRIQTDKRDNGVLIEQGIILVI